MSAGARVAIRLTVTPILIALFGGLLYWEHERISRPEITPLLILPVLITVVCAAAALEIYRMARIKGRRPAWIAGTAYVLLALLSMTFEPAFAGPIQLIFLLYILVKLVLFRPVFAVEDAALTALPAFYILLLQYAINLYLLIKPSTRGLHDLPVDEVRPAMIRQYADSYMLLLAAIFIASKVPDMLGYIVGKTMGRHPMAPILSPSKTWEGGIAGFCGGFMGSLSLVFLTSLRHDLGLGKGLLIVFCAAVTISAIVGDLVKSALKRWAGVKDSGIIPELGGVLDIVDSFLLSVPTAYLVISLGQKLC